MTDPSDIRAVCFDLGGVIIQIARSWDEGCARAGIDPRHSADDLAPLLERWHALVTEHQSGRLEGPAYFSSVSALVNGHYTPDEIARIHHAWTGEPYPNVEPMLHCLRHNGVLTAAVSNTNHEHWTTLREMPALQLMQHHFVSHEIGHTKPDEAIYRFVEETLGINGKHILFFDDLPENVAGAQQFGWAAVQIDHAGDTVAQMQQVLHAHGIVLDAASTPLR